MGDGVGSVVVGDGLGDGVGPSVRAGVGDGVGSVVVGDGLGDGVGPSVRAGVGDGVGSVVVGDGLGAGASGVVVGSTPVVAPSVVPAIVVLASVAVVDSGSVQSPVG